MKVLFLSRWCPHPANNGAKIRVRNILRSLGVRHEVTLVSFFDPSEQRREEFDAAETGAVRATLVPYRPYSPCSGSALLGLFSPAPRSIAATRSRLLERALRDALARSRYDVVVASEVWMAAYRRHFPVSPTVFENLELGLFTPAADARPWLRAARARLTWEKHRRYIRRLASRFDACTVVSEAERSLLLGIVPGHPRVRVIPNALDLSGYSPRECPREPFSLIFTGGFRFFANLDAMRWFLADIHPRIPGARLTITGETEGYALPDGAGVRRTGLVPDVRPHIASSAVAVAPIRMGGGTRLKVLEAMALGTPVVATTKAVEGLDVENGTHLLVADGPGEFAEAVLRILHSPELGARLARNALALVRSKYDWNVVGAKLCELVEEVVHG